MYQKKYIWGPVKFDEVVKKKSKKLREDLKISITPSDVMFKIAEKIENGEIKLHISPFKFNNQRMIKLGGKNVKKKQKR
jgi:hypothetical protein